jgi:hypothetical protein
MSESYSTSHDRSAFFAFPTMEHDSEPTATEEAAATPGIHERLATLASAVDGLYRELDTLTRRKRGGRLSAGAAAHLADLVSDARELLPSDLHLERTDRLIKEGDPLDAKDARLHLAQVTQALRRAGGTQVERGHVILADNPQVSNPVSWSDQGRAEYELWLAAHMG